jgi:hypothetical protein
MPLPPLLEAFVVEALAQNDLDRVRFQEETEARAVFSVMRRRLPSGPTEPGERLSGGEGEWEEMGSFPTRLEADRYTCLVLPRLAEPGEAWESRVDRVS